MLFESVATQTAEVEKRSIGCSTNNLDRSNLRIPFVHEISDEQNSKLSIGSTQNSTSDAKMGILQKSPSEFSDISDDGAPMLEKEGVTRQ